MAVTKIFKQGDLQMVNIPKEFHLSGNKVKIFKCDGDLIIRELPQNLSDAFISLPQVSDDFFAEGR